MDGYLRSGACLLLLLLAAACSLGQERECAVCRRPLHRQIGFLVQLDDGSQKRVCCPRCGLHFMSGRTDVEGALVTDYITERQLPAADAIYLENSTLMLCCRREGDLKRDLAGQQFQRDWDRCLPSLVAFAERGQAEQVRTRLGGRLLTYEQLLAEPDFKPHGTVRR